MARKGNVDGVLIIDKPAGPTSFEVVRRVRRALGEKSAGHTGTLDPMATGVLPVCLGEATKIAPFLVEGDKEYEAEALLGEERDTQDAKGRVTATADPSGVTEARLREALARLVGEIEQVPPMYSAVKVAGRRLHELADFIVVDRDVFSVPLDELKDVRVLQTYVGGELGYSNRDAEAPARR